MTLKEIRELHAQGLTDSEIAQKLGVRLSSVHYMRKTILQLPSNTLARIEAVKDTIRELHAQGLTDLEIAHRMGYAVSTINGHRRQMGLPFNPQVRPQRRYTVYKRKTDELLAFGSARECAKQLGITLASFYSAVSRAKTREEGRYEVFVDEVDEED